MEEDGCWILTDILMYWCQVFSFQITFTNIMGQSTSKGKISQEDLQFLLKNTNHSKEEIMVSWFNLHLHQQEKHWSFLREEKVNLRSETANPWCDDIRNNSLEDASHPIPSIPYQLFPSFHHCRVDRSALTWDFSFWKFKYFAWWESWRTV